MAQAGDPISQDYAAIQRIMRDIVSQNAGRVSLISIGTNNQGVTIEGLKIGNGTIHNLLVATHHGNEYGSTEVAKGFMRATAAVPIQGQTVFVIPVLNIPGYNSRNRYETSIDPNRDYPGPCGTSGPFRLKSTSALAAFIDRENIVASETLHTHGPMVLYPWGLSTHDTKTEYNDLFIQLGQAAARESGYTVGNSTDLLYPADGTFEDYSFWKHGTWSMLFELGTTHSPTQAQVDQMVAVNVPGMRRMFEVAPTSRADRHGFTGKCDTALKALDRHDE